MFFSSTQSQLKYFLAAASVVIGVYVFLLPQYHPHSGLYGVVHTVTHLPLPRDAAANATLGVSLYILLILVRQSFQTVSNLSNTFLSQFQKILAISPRPSWRTRGLRAAALQTGIEIEIPKQAHVLYDLALAFEKLGPEDARHPSNGSAFAWLTHLDMLKYVIENDFDTALILEDDVDWDLSLKEQMQLISDNVRNFTNVYRIDQTPYGRNWDVFWIGHCGEGTEWDLPRLEFNDTTPGRPVPMEAYYSAWGKDSIRNIGEGHRTVQKSQSPVCSFGYAVTQDGAQRLLDLAGRGAEEAFDVALNHLCGSGQLRCLSVNPEVIQSYLPGGGGYVSIVGSGDADGKAQMEETFEKIKGETGNARQSARCAALFNETCMSPWQIEILAELPFRDTAPASAKEYDEA